LIVIGDDGQSKIFNILDDDNKNDDDEKDTIVRSENLSEFWTV
jgi:hypothetical protein